MRLPWPPLLLQCLLAACCLVLAGCQTPTRTAQALWGRWEGGGTTLIFTAHGLYGLGSPGRRPNAGYYGIPRPNQILVSQAVGVYYLRNIWQIETLEGDHLTVVFPNQQRVELTRSKASPPEDPLVAGLWLSPAQGRSILEITPEGDYVRIYWWAQRRRVVLGRVRTDKGRIRFINESGISRETTYLATVEHLSFRAKPPNRETTYSRINDPTDLFRQR